jgi:hypothetical protein
VAFGVSPDHGRGANNRDDVWRAHENDAVLVDRGAGLDEQLVANCGPGNGRRTAGLREWHAVRYSGEMLRTWRGLE